MKFRLTWKDFYNLYSAARTRNRSCKDYYAFEEVQGSFLCRFLISRGVPIEGRQVLDLGAGFGGYAAALAHNQAKVVALDLSPRGGQSAPWVCANAEMTPFREGQFDLIICASLVEHVASPRTLLEEILRVVKTGGIVYLSYPPYYSPLGGHQFAPFHLFGERIALRVARIRSRHFRGKPEPSSFPISFRTAFGSWGLYPLTISAIKKEIGRMPFEMLECSTRWLPFDLSGIPLLGEFLTWHVQFLLRKKAPEASS